MNKSINEFHVPIHRTFLYSVQSRGSSHIKDFCPLLGVYKKHENLTERTEILEQHL